MLRRFERPTTLTNPGFAGGRLLSSKYITSSTCSRQVDNVIDLIYPIGTDGQQSLTANLGNPHDCI